MQSGVGTLGSEREIKRREKRLIRPDPDLISSQLCVRSGLLLQCASESDAYADAH